MNLGKFESNTLVTSFVVIAVLCSMSILSEGQSHISNTIFNTSENWYFTLDVIVVVFLFVAITYNIKHKNLEIVCHTTLISFYGIVVLNNLLVIVANTGLRLNLQKLFVLFAGLFVFYSFAINFESSLKKDCFN